MSRELQIWDIYVCSDDSEEMKLQTGDFPEYKRYLDDIREARVHQGPFQQEEDEQTDEVKMLKILASLSAKDVCNTKEVRDRHGNSMVHNMIATHTINLIQQVISPNEVHGDFQHAAAQNTDARVYQYQLEHKADYNAVNIYNELPLHKAQQCNNINMAKALLKKEGVQLTQRTHTGMTVLMQACITCPNVVGLILSLLLDEI